MTRSPNTANSELGTSYFEVIPAVDLRDGNCVRLFQGDYDRETRYSNDPVRVALRWQEQGAPRLHVVDLDGARAGRAVNYEVMARVCAAVEIPVEVSGGLREMEAIEGAIAYGASRIQLGSAAVRDRELLKQVIERYGDAICVSIDARDGKVATDGWQNPTQLDVFDFAGEMAELGVARVMVTDIGRDSTLTSPNFELLEALVTALPIPVVASGGVATVEHLLTLAHMGCEGAIVGKALYEGTIDLPSAIAAVGGRRC